MNLNRYILPILALSLLCEYTLFANNGIASEEKNTSKLNVAASLNHNEQLNKAFENQVYALTPYVATFYPTASENELKTRQQIDATLNKVVSENRFVQFLDANAIIDLPVGIKSEIGNLSYTVLIDSLILTPAGSFLFASMAFDAPKIGRIHFRSGGIKFSKSGGIADIGVLELVGDYGIDISETQRLMIQGGRQATYVEMDCYGFRQMSLDASLVLSREKFLPEDQNGKVIPDQNVAFSFTTVVSDWNDLLVAVDVPRFQVVGLNDFSFEVQQATLDLSDLRNAPTVVFPQNYRNYSPFLNSGNPNLWQGVYINQVSVYLPPQFDSGSPERASINGYHLLIDDQGFSGVVTAEDVIPIDKGKIAKWDFSLDELHLAMVANEVREVGFRGKINVPINEIKEGDQSASHYFQYTALLLLGNEYLFNVSNPDKVSFDLWKTSEVTLHPSSHILITLEDGEFRAAANLNGEMTINVGLRDGGEPDVNEDKNVRLAGVQFQDLRVQSVAPYVRVGAFSLGTKNNRLGGYPIRVNRIGGRQSDDELFLDVDVTLALTGDQGGNFGAGGGFRMVSRVMEQGDNISYQYKKLEVNRFELKIDQGSFGFTGNLNFYKTDPVYGQGLHGTLTATFVKFSLAANAIFGTKSGNRYWCVDALADLGNGAPLGPGIYLNRFGGGASYHMQRTNDRLGSQIIPEEMEIMYRPDETVGLGVKAIAGLKGQNEKLFHAEAIFEMSFRKTGGLRNISLRGNAFLLSSPKLNSVAKLKEDARLLASLAKQSDLMNGDPLIANEIFGPPDVQDAQVFAGVLINYDFDARILHANLKAVINVAQGVVTGGGDAVMHFAPDEWYIYIGRPEYAKRFNLNLLGIARADAYFVMGSTVPDTPPPPENVSAIMGGIDLDYMSDLNALSDGKGVGFGASLRLDTGNKTFLIFYGRFQAGLGFDVMMRDYGGVTCSGRGALGIDGWYANGQAYAYFDGNIGVQVRLFGTSRKVDILKIGAAVVAQAKLPNPVWIKGTVGGHFSVLGGLVKGKCSFEVTIGEECEIRDEGSVLEGVEVIAQLTPQEGLSEVDVFTAPQAVFNYEMETTYQLLDLNSQPVDFRIALDQMELTGPSGPMDVSLQWNADHTVAVVQTDEILPEHTQIELTVSASLNERQNGSWKPSTANGNPLTESRHITFTTGEAPGYISPSNVAYSYPMKNMLNLYKDESRNGYIKLIQGQDYLFEDSDYTPVIRFQSGNDRSEVPVNYNKAQNQLNFSFPSLKNGTVYKMTVINKPKKQTDIEENITVAEQRITSVDATVATRQATGSITSYEEQQLYQSTFRTSIYNTFPEKLANIQLSSGWRYPVSTGVHIIGANFGGLEPFSREELFGTDGSKPMVRMEADLTRNDWFYGKVNPLIYETYPLPGGITISPTTRDTDILGLIPVRAIRLNQYPRDFSFNEGATGPVSFASFRGAMEYQLAYFINQDFRDLRNQAGNHIYKTGSTNNILTRLIQSRFPVIEKGQYVLDLDYYLPGDEQSSSTYRHSIYNPLN